MGMKSGGLSLDSAAMLSGAAFLDTVRGDTTWGANYVFNSGGIQGDIRLISDELNSISDGGTMTDTSITSGLFDACMVSSNPFTPRSSGDATETLGSASKPFAASGLIMNADDGSGPMRLVIYANGLVSGVAI